MKRIDINPNQLNFIGAWNLENNNLCYEIIDFFEKNLNLQKKGVTSDSSNNKAIKSTTDITISPIDLKDKNFNVFNNYIKELHNCYVDYQKQWPFLKSIFNDIQIRDIKVDIDQFNVEITNFSKVANNDSINVIQIEAKNSGDGIAYCTSYVDLTNLTTGKQERLMVKRFTIE